MEGGLFFLVLRLIVCIPGPGLGWQDRQHLYMGGGGM